MANTAGRIPVEERLFSLVLALLATDTGLTKSEILSTVQGYRQRYAAGGDNAALERQFERDKDDIRDLGVPLETVETPGESGNNQLLRYRIPRGAYELPDDVAFTPEEATLLSLAARVWREGSLSGESRRALVKLRSLGASPDDPLLGYAPRVRARDTAFEPLSTALEKHLMVRFPYLKPGEQEAREREVIPLAIVQYQGRWHLFAEEAAGASATTRGAEKMFLLRRIVGPVVLGKPAPARPGDHSSRALRQLDEVGERSIAEVRVEPGSDAATRLANRRSLASRDGDVYRIHYVDLPIMADELAGFGPEVLVIAPAELRDAVRERLERTAAAHG